MFLLKLTRKENTKLFPTVHMLSKALFICYLYLRVKDNTYDNVGKDKENFLGSGYLQ